MPARQAKAARSARPGSLLCSMAGLLTAKLMVAAECAYSLYCLHQLLVQVSKNCPHAARVFSRPPMPCGFGKFASAGCMAAPAAAQVESLFMLAQITTCSAGRSSPFDASRCEACGPDKFVPKASIACITCGAGKFSVQASLAGVAADGRADAQDGQRRQVTVSSAAAQS